jgi:hypothetical protein
VPYSNAVNVDPVYVVDRDTVDTLFVVNVVVVDMIVSVLELSTKLFKSVMMTKLILLAATSK